MVISLELVKEEDTSSLVSTPSPFAKVPEVQPDITPNPPKSAKSAPKPLGQKSLASSKTILETSPNSQPDSPAQTPIHTSTATSLLNRQDNNIRQDNNLSQGTNEFTRQGENANQESHDVANHDQNITSPPNPSTNPSDLYRLGSVNNPLPNYPRLARMRGLEGLVLVRVKLDSQKGGSALAVDLAQSSGYDLLDNAAIDTISLWKFHPVPQITPTTPAQVELTIPIRFRLTQTEE